MKKKSSIQLNESSKKRLHQILLESAKTSLEIAEITGVSNSTISSFMHQRADAISDNTLQVLSEHFAFNKDYIMNAKCNIRSIVIDPDTWVISATAVAEFVKAEKLLLNDSNMSKLTLSLHHNLKSKKFTAENAAPYLYGQVEVLTRLGSIKRSSD